MSLAEDTDSETPDSTPGPRAARRRWQLDDGHPATRRTVNAAVASIVHTEMDPGTSMWGGAAVRPSGKMGAMPYSSCSGVRGRRFLIPVLITILAGAPAALAQAANSCTDPYWKHTLRCQFAPSQTPQPESPATPPEANDIPDFTRVWLDSDPALRCVDGTRPLIYVDKAICTDPSGCGTSAYGEPVDSNRWMFTIPGGGSCHSDYCLNAYADPAERGEMSSATKPEMKEMEGIHRPDPVRNPVFAGYNRVRVEKCSYDRYLGRSTAEAEGGALHGQKQDGTAIDYNLYQHGALMFEETFGVLADGLEYATWKRSGAEAVATTETLPPLSDAEVVLIVGHSGANHGLFHNLDRLAAALAALPGFGGDVRAVLDANFIPGLENEAAFSSTAPPESDAYSGITAGTSSTSKSGPFTYDGGEYHETGLFRLQYDAWDAQLDASCLDAHEGEIWLCRDRHHVLLNHVSTPFLQREDVSDPNPEHNDGPRGHRLQFADDAAYPDCTGGSPCDPRLTREEYRARVTLQAQTLIDSASTRSEMARGIDESGPFPTFYLWLPDCGKHDGVYADASYYVASMGGYTLRHWIEEFLRAPRTGTKAWLIDGVENGSGTVVRSQCQGARARRRAVRH